MTPPKLQALVDRQPNNQEKSFLLFLAGLGATLSVGSAAKSIEKGDGLGIAKGGVGALTGILKIASAAGR